MFILIFVEGGLEFVRRATLITPDGRLQGVGKEKKASRQHKFKVRKDACVPRTKGNGVSGKKDKRRGEK